MLKESDEYCGYSTIYNFSDYCMKKTNKSFLSNKWKKIINTNEFDDPKSREFLTRLVFQGIPNDVRGDVWSKFACLNIEIPDVENYETLHTNASQAANDIILRDSNRTFPCCIGNERGGSFIDILIKILRSYAAIDPDVGYTQGMNFIVSIPLVITTNEYKSFCIFYGMMQNPLIYLRDIYKDGFPGFFELSNIWSYLLEVKYPWLFHKLQDSNVNILILVAKCFQSILLAYDVPLELKMNMFDRIILFGKVSLLSFQMTVIRIFSNELKKMSGTDCQHFLLRADQNEIYNDVPYFIKLWNEEWISITEFERIKDIVNTQK